MGVRWVRVVGWLLLPSYPWITLASSTSTASLSTYYCHPTPSHHILPWILLPSYTVLPYPTPSYTVSYLVLHWILLPFYHILPSRTHPIPNYLLSYLVLHWTLLPSYPVLPYHNFLRPTLVGSFVVGRGRMDEKSSVGCGRMG